MSDELGEKTEQPSAKKRKDAREKGQVARSQDLVAAISLLSVTAAMAWAGSNGLPVLANRVAADLKAVGDRAHQPLVAADIVAMVTVNFAAAAPLMLPIIGVAAFMALSINLAQGWVFAPEQLSPHWERLSPSNGLSRLKPSKSLIDLVKTLIAAVAIGLLAWQIIREVLATSPQMVWMTPEASAMEAWRRLRSLLYQVGMALLAIAAADYAVQRWRFTQQLKMTKQEVRDEAKSSEGSPETKGRIRKIQSEMGRRRMLGAVKTATVVITNPTHYAVALRYQRSTMSAPVVVAKGKDLLALRIRELAREHSVVIVENPPLARALHQHGEVGQAIPADLFSAVAEVLAYLVRLKQVLL